MSLPKSEGVFAVRIVTSDHYTAPPLRGFDPVTSVFRQAPVKHAPVLRIFGSTPAGQKCCLHVHGVFPYFSIPSPVPSPSEDFLKQFAAAIDAALNSSFEKAGKNQPDNIKLKFDRQYVHEIIPFRGIPFYGFHPDETAFLKILFYNPLIVKKAGEILQGGAIMNIPFQPYELHVPYELKFMIDHDLYGMDYITTKDVKFRFNGIVDMRAKRHGNKEPENLSQKVWNVSVLEDQFRLPPEIERISTCELEADVLATDIVRPSGSNDASGVQNPGLRFIWKDEIDRRKAFNIGSTPTIPVSQDRAEMPKLSNELMQFETLSSILEGRQEKSAEESFVETPELDISGATFGEVSFRNMSLTSDHSASGALLELIEREGMIVGVTSEAPAEEENIADESQGKSDDEEEEEDEAQVEIEMSQRIEEFSDSDDDLEDGVGRIEQVDGPGPAEEVDELSEVIDLASDVSDNDNDMNSEYSHGSHVDENQCSPEVARISSSDGGPCLDVDVRGEVEIVQPETSVASVPVQPQRKIRTKRTGPYPVLTSGLKPPTRKEMINWVADPAKKRTYNRMRSVTGSGRPENDIDAVDIEEIQARLSPDESIMISDNMSFADGAIDRHNGIDKTPASVAVKAAVSERRSSKGTLISSRGKSRKSTITSKKVAKRLAWSQPKNGLAHFDVTFASARDVSILEDSRIPLDKSHSNPTVVAAKAKLCQVMKFLLRRRRKAEGQAVTPKSKRRSRKSVAKRKSAKKRKNVSELDAPTIVDSFGFNSTEMNLAGAQITQGAPCLTVITLEIHVQTRHDMRPDPEFDSVSAVFYAFQVDNATGQHLIKGVVAICQNEDEKRQMTALKGFDRFHCKLVDSELLLFHELVEIIRIYDPDILVGYEIQLLSWGFLFERAQFVGVDLCTKVSRIPESPRHSRFSSRDDWWSLADIHVAGRIVLNLGRIMRHEVTLYMYSFENVVYNALRQRVPYYEYRTLTQWFSSMSTRGRVFEYYFFRVVAEIDLMNHCDILNRSSELARLYGIQFYEVLSRGSQFRVESMLLRMARTQNYVALSPSIKQRNRMAAPECIALTMEPESRFYTEPVLVLDFQSLYPSMVIAYNYCFSTCLGRVQNYARGDTIDFGCYNLKVPTDMIKSLMDNMTISPAGVAFVKSNVRRGIMPQMLEEILDTRVMVKQSAKLYKDDKSLQKILDARQLGLKLIANVTYGYTAATYSGRMPCVEIADSIVQKGRETLLRAVEMVKNGKNWNARVVYGDTDSLFVHLPGCSKEEAFRIGQEIVDAVTAENPKPVKLKFEKVYYPCVLQTKKRYVGYAYETLDQKEPTFDAKGIETVRRDVCPAVAKILQKSLETLFVSKQVSTVRQYVTRQFQRIHHGRVSPLDFIFTRKYRGRENYKPDAVAPALRIAKRRLQKDRRAEPRIKERVPYLIVNGHPGSTLISCVREPSEFVSQKSLRLNYRYYITKQICPALNRIFNIIGVDTLEWYRSMPRVDRTLYGYGFGGRLNGNQAGVPNPVTISQFFNITECPVCRNITTSETFCVECAATPQRSMMIASSGIRQLERRHESVHRLCNMCMMWRATSVGCNRDQSVECTSIVCPVTYKRTELDYDLEQASALRIRLQKKYS